MPPKVAPKVIEPPAPKRVIPQTYPKWMKLGDLALVVNNEAEEAAISKKTAKVEVVKSAQGDSHTVILPQK